MAQRASNFRGMSNVYGSLVAQSVFKRSAAPDWSFNSKKNKPSPCIVKKFH